MHSMNGMTVSHSQLEKYTLLQPPRVARVPSLPSPQLQLYSSISMLLCCPPAGGGRGQERGLSSQVYCSCRHNSMGNNACRRETEREGKKERKMLHCGKVA